MYTLSEGDQPCFIAIVSLKASNISGVGLVGKYSLFESNIASSAPIGIALVTSKTISALMREFLILFLVS